MIISVYWILSLVIVTKDEGLLKVTGGHVHYSRTCANISETVRGSNIQCVPKSDNTKRLPLTSANLHSVAHIGVFGLLLTNYV